MSPEIEKNNLSIKSRYRREIDGLRAFAVITVIINHFNKEILPSGYLGVDIFFVISGFVITSSLYQRPSKNFKDFISGFYERRLKRIVPALSVFVLIMSITICLFDPQPILSLRTGITSLFGLSNLYLLKQSTDYFAQPAEFNVFTHTWSLGVEEQFYILFPFLIWFSGFGRQTKNGTRNLALIIGVLIIASLIGFLYLYPINQSAAYFLMPTRFWEMATGCLIFITFEKKSSIEKLLGRVNPFLLISLIIGVMYLPISFGTVSTVAVVILTLVLIASLKKQTAAYIIFTNPKVVYIGLISYSLYLWHWGILSISRWTIGVHWWSIPFQFVLMLILAIVSYRYIETPLRKSNWFRKKWKNLILGGGFLVTLASSIGVISGPIQEKLYSGKKKNIMTTTYNQDNWRSEIRLGNSSLTGKKCHANKFFTSNQLNLLFNECKFPLRSEEITKSKIAFVGDSHTLALLDAEEIFTNLGFQIIHFSHAGCPFPIPPYGIYPHECEQFLNNAEMKTFQNLNSGDSIVIHNYHLRYFGGKNLQDTRDYFYDRRGKLVSDPSKKIDLYMKGLKKLANKAFSKSMTIYLIGSPYRNPNLSFRKEWFRLSDPAMETLIEEANNAKKMNNIISQKIKDNSMTNVIFIDPIAILNKSCGRNIESYLECFRDGDHMSNQSSKELLDFLMKNYLKQ